MTDRITFCGIDFTPEMLEKLTAIAPQLKCNIGPDTFVEKILLTINPNELAALAAMMRRNETPAGVESIIAKAVPKAIELDVTDFVIKALDELRQQDTGASDGV
jgi:hypothetical protein